MIKYYGLWYKSANRWSIYKWHRQNPDKRIGTTSLWLNKDKLWSNFTYKHLFEIREFTPADALLAKCGKIK